MRKKLIIIIISLIVISITIIITVDYRIEKTTDQYVYSDIKKISHNKVGLLLGTSKKSRSGHTNYFFRNRIKAAVELFKAGKIDYILVTGDNSINEYNEPLDMKKELIKSGIPKNKIYLDFAGFRTYDSVIRLYKVFGQKKFTVISQEFHNRRAVYIAKNYGLQAVAYNAEDVKTYHGFLTKFRELFARVNAVWDLIIDKEPKFLGERIEIK